MKRQYLIFVDMCTGTVGEGATDVMLTNEVSSVPSYAELLESCTSSADEMAKDNAQSFDNDGYLYCNDCGEEVDGGDTCDCCGGSNIDWVDNDAVQGTPSFYKPKLHDGQRGGGGSFLEEYPTAMVDDEGYFYVPVLDEESQLVIDKLLEKIEFLRTQSVGLAAMNSVLVRSMSEISEQVDYATNQTEILMNKLKKGA